MNDTLEMVLGETTECVDEVAIGVPARRVDSALGFTIWWFNLNLRPQVLEPLREILSRDERSRADRFRSQCDRVRFIARRGLLRIVLGRELGIRAESLRFRSNVYGKPALEVADVSQGLRFSSSQCGGMAAIGLARGRELGVDIERVDARFDHMAVARAVFAAGEIAALEALRGAARTRAFFHCWTRKEAYLKARGMGLSRPMDSFEMSLAPEAATLRSVRGEAAEPDRWSVIPLSFAPDYVGAVVIERSKRQ